MGYLAYDASALFQGGRLSPMSWQYVTFNTANTADLDLYIKRGSEVAKYPENYWADSQLAEAHESWVDDYQTKARAKADAEKLALAEHTEGVLQPWVDLGQTVVGHFKKELGSDGKVYEYGLLYLPALKRWYLTGPKSPRDGLTTAELVVFLVSGEPVTEITQLGLPSTKDNADAG